MINFGICEDIAIFLSSAKNRGNMKINITFFPEIILKSKPVRKKFTNILRTNIAMAIKGISSELKVKNLWDKIEIAGQDVELTENVKNQLFEKLQKIPGIEYFSEIEEHDFLSIQDVSEKAYEIYKDTLPEKSLCIRVKRAKDNNFTAKIAETEIGSFFIKNSPTTTVNLKNPDVLVRIRTNTKNFSIEKNRIYGLSGFPVGAQEKVLSLISGGFDSGVSTYLMMKKGAKVDYLFFNLGGRAHSLGVKEVSKYLAEEFSDGYENKFITVEFEEVVADILENVHHKYRGVILKRLFYKAADKIAKDFGYQALVTGEATGQVSSQTITNLNVINQASETVVLRPLLAMDKVEIIKIAQKIGTEDFAKNMPEYCGVISDKPSTAAKLDIVLDEEKNLSEELLEKVIENREVIRINEYDKDENQFDGIEIAHFAHKDEIIIDVRDEEKRKKTNFSYKNKILEIPFYKLNNAFKDLDQTKMYVLYCDKGVVSKLVALNLRDAGYQNIKVLRPFKKGCEI
jgi:thiamine biosynthesis protein ThiI